MTHVTGGDPLLQRIGAANTIVFTDSAIEGHNTDHSGFVSAYRAAFSYMPPGAVVQIGAGGVGRAVAFALVALGASEIRLIDTDVSKARSLASALEAISAGATRVSVHDSVAVCAGADAVLNCTPIGMVGYPGTPLPARLLAGIGWGFDAVYTPVETTFKADAEAAGARFLSGFELFFYQGVHAFEIFAGCDLPDRHALRRRLLDLVEAEETEAQP